MEVQNRENTSVMTNTRLKTAYVSRTGRSVKNGLS